MPAQLDCLTCGACCREAFDAVPVEDEDDAFAAKHPELVDVASDGYRSLTRVPSPLGCGTRCASLRGDGSRAPFTCAIYDERPTPCAELEVGGEACLLARCRVGLDPWPPGTVPDGPWVVEGFSPPNE